MAIGSSLPGSYNYVRNSVKVVIDAYSGKMTFYDADPQRPDPAGLLGGLPEHVRADLEDAGLAAGPPALPAGHLLHSVRHLRALPPDELGPFYAASNAWQLSPTAGAGPQSQALLAQNTYNNQGQLVSTTPARMAPQYQVYSLPGTDPDKQVFTVSDGFVPASQSNLSELEPELQPDGLDGRAWPTRGSTASSICTRCRRGRPARPTRTPRSRPTSTVSSDITLLDQHGSEVLLGETLMVPIANSMVYLRPLYASPTTNPQPQLQYVVGVLGKNVQIDTSLSAVLSDLLNTTVSLPSESGGVSSTGTVPAAVAGILQQAQTDYTNALAALKAGNLAEFQTDINQMQAAIAQAQQVIEATTPGATTTTTTTTTAPPVKGGKTKKRRHDHDDLAPGDDVLDDHLGADEHRAQERHDDHILDLGLGGAQDLSGRTACLPVGGAGTGGLACIPVAAGAARVA